MSQWFGIAFGTASDAILHSFGILFGTASVVILHSFSVDQARSTCHLSGAFVGLLDLRRMRRSLSPLVDSCPGALAAASIPNW